jgi:hypothetical protein
VVSGDSSETLYLPKYKMTVHIGKPPSTIYNCHENAAQNTFNFVHTKKKVQKFSDHDLEKKLSSYVWIYTYYYGNGGGD